MSLRTRYRNFKLRKDRWLLMRALAGKMREARQNNNVQIADDWWGEHGWEVNIIDEEFRHNDSRAVLDQADRFHLPHPEVSDADKWVSKDELLTPQMNWRILTPQARLELVTAIRKEKRERRETWEWWIKLGGAGLALATGLVGAITGLVATYHTYHTHH
jgi:hypothetical protein